MTYSPIIPKVFFLLFLLTGVFKPAISQVADEELIHHVDSVLEVIRDLNRSGLRTDVKEEFVSLKKLTTHPKGYQTEIHGRVRFEEGKILSIWGNYNDADAAYQSAIDIFKVQEPRDDRIYIDALNRLANQRETIGDYPGAISCIQEIIHFRKAVLDVFDPKVIVSVTNLARLYRKMGDYGKAESYLVEYIASVAHVKITMDEDYAELLFELADLYSEIDDFERAEPRFLEALSYFNNEAKKKLPIYIPLLTGIAELYLKMGQKEEAQDYIKKVKRKTNRNILMKPGPVMMSLARMSRANEEYDDAEELYLDGMEYLENRLQQKSPVYAELTYELAALYFEQGDIESAKANYLNAYNLWQQMEGPRVPGYPQTMMGLAHVYMEEGKYDNARDLLVSSKHYWEDKVGIYYPLYLINILDLARLSWKTGQYEDADSLFHEVARLGRNRLSSAAHYMTARELNKYMQKIFDAQAETISFALDSPVHTLSTRACYDNALFYKGFLLNNSIQIRRKASRDSLAEIQYRQMNNYRRLLASEFEKADTINIVQELYIDTIKSLEKELIRMLTNSESSDLFQQRSWNQVVGSLQYGEAAIEFVRYRSYEDETKDSIMYVALVLVPGVTQPYMVPLFNEEVLSFILEPVEERTWKYVKSIYTSDMRGMVRSGPSRATLYELIWKKIEALPLTNVQTIYIAPAGVLHRINLGAIAISQDSLISDRYTIVNLNSTRQLIPVLQSTYSRDSTVVIFGGISYDSIPADVFRVADIQQFSQDFSMTQETFDQDANRTGTLVQWNYLQGTELEAITLAEICDSVHLNYKNYAGSEATESLFKSIGELGDPPSPWLLHIGTHGFFLDDPGPQNTDHMLNSIPPFREEDQPMMRSGLVMAGANYLQKHTVNTSLTLNNGVLYAEEISHLDFSNTRLAVLSACDTGLGKIQGDEGVFGLQRAFRIAGAHYLIMSLWQLSDEKTSVFMDTFYSRCLSEGESIPEAFRNTQKEMRIRFIDHYDWAGFILLE